MALAHLAYTAFPSLDWFSLHVTEFQSRFSDIEIVAMGHESITDIHRQLGPSVVVRLLFYPYFDRLALLCLLFLSVLFFNGHEWDPARFFSWQDMRSP
jgi:hypothetical protein